MKIHSRIDEEPKQWVQIKTSGSAHCALIVDAWSTLDGGDFFKVRAVLPLVFTGSYPVKAVRQCSGLDGRCACAGEFDQVHASAVGTNEVAA